MQHGRKMSKSLGNVVAPQKVIDALGADVLRLWVASHRLPQRDVGLRRDPQAQRRRLPPHPQHRALPARQPRRFRPGACTCVPLDDMVALDRWVVHRAARTAATASSAAYERYDFAEIVQALVELLQRRPGRAVPRRDQGPPVHDAGGLARPPFGAERDVPHRRGVRALDRADPGLHRRRDLALPAGATRARTTCCSPPGTTAWPSLGEDARAVGRRTSSACWRCARQVSKVLEPMRADGEIGAALEAEIALRTPTSPTQKLAGAVRRRTALPVHHVGDVEAASRRDRRASRTSAVLATPTHQDQVRALLALPRRRRQRCRRIRSCAARCVRNVDGAGETRKWF